MSFDMKTHTHHTQRSSQRSSFIFSSLSSFSIIYNSILVPVLGLSLIIVRLAQ